jgi:hypothetical protein
MSKDELTKLQAATSRKNPKILFWIQAKRII